MKYKVSDRELELLSAYLDNELSPKEQVQIEARLESNPRLRRILGELHQNRAAIRSLPRLRAPRNFTLSPEVAGVKPMRRTYPAFGIVSALSSLVLILVLVGDFLFQPAMVSQPIADQPAAEALAVETTSEVEILREAEIILTPQAEAPEELPQAAPAESEAEAESVVMEVEGTAGTPAVETPKGIDTFSSKIPQITATQPTQGDTATPSPTQTAIQPTQTPTISTPAVTIDSEVIEPVESVMPSSTITIEPPPVSSPPYIQILEISLAVIALGTGALAIFLRSRNQ